MAAELVLPLAGGSAVVGRGLPVSVFLSQPPPLAMCVSGAGSVYNEVHTLQLLTPKHQETFEC